MFVRWRRWRAARLDAPSMLVPGARQAWRWWSVRLSTIGSLLSAAALAFPDQLLTLWNMMPGELRSLVPTHVGSWISILLFLAVIVARIVPQRSAKDGR